MIGEVRADCTGTIFSDVNETSVGYQFCDYIERFSVLGITTGYPDGTFRPASSPTRGQMAAFFMRAIDNVVQSQIKVYDANDQYIGNFLYFDGHMNVFIPSMKIMTKISVNNGDISGDLRLFFESDNCSGQAYAGAGLLYVIVKNSGKSYIGSGNEYYDIDAMSTIPDGYDCSSLIQTMYNVVPVVEVTELPFSIPVALPMRFE
jgi:prepilin-type processing-associated H-X9-DG protein